MYLSGSTGCQYLRKNSLVKISRMFVRALDWFSNQIRSVHRLRPIPKNNTIWKKIWKNMTSVWWKSLEARGLLLVPRPLYLFYIGYCVKLFSDIHFSYKFTPQDNQQGFSHHHTMAPKWKCNNTGSWHELTSALSMWNNDALLLSLSYCVWTSCHHFLIYWSYDLKLNTNDVNSVPSFLSVCWSNFRRRFKMLELKLTCYWVQESLSFLEVGNVNVKDFPQTP